MFYYINDACFDLTKVAFFTRSKFTPEPVNEDTVPQTIFTINIVFTNVTTPLVISYLDEAERNNDFQSIREVIHGYGRPQQ